MAKITRIKAGEGEKAKNGGEKVAQAAVKAGGKVTKKAQLTDGKAEKLDKVSALTDERKAKKAEKKQINRGKKSKTLSSARVEKKPKKILAPFRYVRDSWREIRQVRWPNRKETWKMTLSVVIYVVAFAAVIMLLDAFFAWIFNLILGE